MPEYNGQEIPDHVPLYECMSEKCKEFRKWRIGEIRRLESLKRHMKDSDIDGWEQIDTFVEAQRTWIYLLQSDDSVSPKYRMFLKCDCNKRTEIKRYNDAVTRKLVYDDLVSEWNRSLYSINNA